MGCRACGENGLQEVFHLGRLPLANALLQAGQLDLPEPSYPLNLLLCPRCSLVQIGETVPPQILYGNYLYLSSFSTTFLEHSQRLAERLIAARRLGPQSQVIEVGSNDGYLLQFYARCGIPVLGIEPAANVARVAEEERGIRTLCEFFSEDLARRLQGEGMRADVLHAHNVLAHQPELNGFVRGFKTLLSEEGVLVIEVPHVLQMIEHCEYDTIYHEHLCYFSLTALDRLFRRNELMIEDVERLNIHGGSLRVFAVHAGRGAPKPAVEELLTEEGRWGVARQETYKKFADRAGALRESLRESLSNLVKSGKRLAAYGAAAKGSTLLNYCAIGREWLEFVVDRSPHKHGLYMPGVHIPIYPTARLLEARPDYVLLLAWNFAQEIMAQQEEYRRRGGRFILPIPEVEIV
jgi:SAM-dependent methyltransferase